jgi:hypothetical protein
MAALLPGEEPERMTERWTKHGEPVAAASRGAREVDDER